MKDRLIFAAVFVAWAGLSQIERVDQPVTQDVMITVTKHGSTIHIQNQDGRGLLFYRGMDEVSEYLKSEMPTETWEAQLKDALRQKMKSDPTLRVKQETYSYVESGAVKK